MTQMDLSRWFYGLVPEAAAPQPKPDPAATGRPSIEERFASFHAANPHVFASMLELARARLARGERRIGAKALWEELRRHLQTTGAEAGGEVYRLDNSLTSLYARALLDAETRLVGVIETRQRRAR